MTLSSLSTARCVVAARSSLQIRQSVLRAGPDSGNAGSVQRASERDSSPCEAVSALRSRS